MWKVSTEMTSKVTATQSKDYRGRTHMERVHESNFMQGGALSVRQMMEQRGGTADHAGTHLQNLQLGSFDVEDPQVDVLDAEPLQYGG